MICRESCIKQDSILEPQPVAQCFFKLLMQLGVATQQGGSLYFPLPSYQLLVVPRLLPVDVALNPNNHSTTTAQVAHWRCAPAAFYRDLNRDAAQDAS